MTFRFFNWKTISSWILGIQWLKPQDQERYFNRGLTMCNDSAFYGPLDIEVDNCHFQGFWYCGWISVDFVTMIDSIK